MPFTLVVKGDKFQAARAAADRGIAAVFKEEDNHFIETWFETNDSNETQEKIIEWFAETNLKSKEKIGALIDFWLDKKEN